MPEAVPTKHSFSNAAAILWLHPSAMLCGVSRGTCYLRTLPRNVATLPQQAPRLYCKAAARRRSLCCCSIFGTAWRRVNLRRVVINICSHLALTFMQNTCCAENLVRNMLRWNILTTNAAAWLLPRWFRQLHSTLCSYIWQLKGEKLR